MTNTLLPYDPAEAISVKEAARRAGKSERTIRNWCLDRHIGRRIAGRWAVSAPALDMLLAGDDRSLQAYVAGDRASVRVASYFEARSIPLASFASRVSTVSDHAAMLEGEGK
jgi:hypothetical protein